MPSEGQAQKNSCCRRRPFSQHERDSQSLLTWLYFPAAERTICCSVDYIWLPSHTCLLLCADAMLAIILLLLYLVSGPLTSSAVCFRLVLATMLLLSHLASELLLSAVLCRPVTSHNTPVGASGFRAIYICFCVCRPDASHDSSERDHGTGTPHCSPAACLGRHHSSRSHAHRCTRNSRLLD